MTERDFEVLRTVGRLRLVRAQVLVGVFFSSLRRAQRRLKELRDLGLIVNHRVGLPMYGGTNGPAVYRLTRRGSEALVSHYPDEEHLAEGIERSKGTSLRDHEHHDSLLELYLRTVRGEDGDVSAERASQIRYWADRDVTLTVQTGPHKGDVVPDAVYEPLTGAGRVFVEVDRSNKPQFRLEATARRYAAYAASSSHRPFDEARTPRLLFVVRSEKRAARLAQTIRRLELGKLDVSVLELSHAIEWLRAELFGEAPLSESETASPVGDSHARALLLQLYTHTCEAVREAEKAGVNLQIPALRDAFTYLQGTGDAHGG